MTDNVPTWMLALFSAFVVLPAMAFTGFALVQDIKSIPETWAAREFGFLAIFIWASFLLVGCEAAFVFLLGVAFLHWSGGVTW